MKKDIVKFANFTNNCLSLSTRKDNYLLFRFPLRVEKYKDRWLTLDELYDAYIEQQECNPDFVKFLEINNH